MVKANKMNEKTLKEWKHSEKQYRDWENSLEGIHYQIKTMADTNINDETVVAKVKKMRKNGVSYGEK